MSETHRPAPPACPGRGPWTGRTRATAARPWRRATAALPSLAILLTALAPPAAAEPLTPTQVVTRAQAQSPSLRAALLDERRARQAEAAEEALYVFDFLADTQLSRTVNPSLGFDGGVQSPEQSALTVGAELRRPFSIGTSLSMRLDLSTDLTSRTTQSFGLGADPLTVGPAFGVGLTFAVTQPFLRGAGPTVGEASLRAARAQRTVTERTRDQVASALLRDALVAYWELWYATAAVAIERQSLGLSREQLAQAEARASLGSLAPAEVLQFATRVASLEEQVATADTERQRRAVELARLLGDAGATLEPSADAPQAPAPPSGDLLDQALRTSPDLGESRAAIDVARVRAETAGEELEPRLDLTGTLKLQGLGNDDPGAAFEQLGTFGAVTALVGLTYEMPLDGARRSAEAAAANTAITLAEERLTERRQAVEAQLATASAQDATSRQRIALAERTVDLARRQVEADAARFATGSVTALQVAASEDALRTAELRLARARVDLVSAHLSIAHLTGALLAEHAGDGDTP